MDANRRDLLRDRSWMNYKNATDRRKPEYEDGVNAFLDFAFSNAGNNEKIRCPCVKCSLGSFHIRKTVFYHLLVRGILKDYNPWTQHGEDEIEDDSTPYEDHMPISLEVHLPLTHRENKASDSHKEKVKDRDVHQGEKETRAVRQREIKTRAVRQREKENRDAHQREKENRDVHQENDEDGNEEPPVIPSSVWRYVSSIGKSKTDVGGDVRQANDEENGDQDVSMGEDDNFIGENHSDSSSNHSGEDSDFVATEAEQVTAEGDSPETPYAIYSGHRNTFSTRRRKPRGLKWKKEMGKRSAPVKVELPANLGRVVGNNARQFVNEASWLLKQTLPPNVVKWRDLNENVIAKLFEKVKNRFIFPNESHVDASLLWQFKQWYRHWRSDMRRSYFSKHETYEEQLANRPPDVKEAQWKWLVDYWRTEDFKKLSTIYSKVRRNQKTNSCVGPISIARLAYEMEKNQSQQDPDQYPVYLKLFENQKRRLDGTWINKEAEDGHCKLVTLHKTQLEKHGVDSLTPTEAYAKVFTRARSINLLGLGENPTASESPLKHKRKDSLDKRVVEDAARARVEAQIEQKSSDTEAQIEQNQSDPEVQIEQNQSESESETRVEIRRQIRSIWEGLASSSTNA